MQPPPPGAPPGGYPPPGYPPPGYPPPPGYGYPPPPRKRSLLWLWIVLGVVGAGLVMVAILAAVVVPKADEYVERSKRIEAELNLHAIGRGAKVGYEETGRFPEGDAALTPAASCCEGPNHKCAPDPALWRGEPWESMYFEMNRPHYFRYSYRASADGQSFTATAVGDLDCDGEEVVFTVTGTAVGGNPELSEVVRPTNRD
ncbi:MAG: hypothetical protein IPH80_07155 [Myxococcales bacterium]|nr:hypothetical protein [Myxococcales bacterium]MBP6844822.1 hypothetical protein [Kofleriaceae bacterium]